MGLLLQKDPEQEDPAPEDLYRVGTLTHILRYVTAPDGGHHLVCQGDSRFRVVDFVAGHPFLLARIDRIEDRTDHSPELEARLLLLKQKATEALKLMPQTPAELVNAVQSMESAGALADLVAGYLDLKPDEKQALLEQMDLKLRVDEVLKYLSHRVEVLRLSRQISERTKEQIDTRQREALLREQMRTIQNELGEGQGHEDELRELREAIEAAGMPAAVLETVHKDLRRLERMSDGAAEYAMLRTHLDWMVELPWSRLSEERLDLAQAQTVLDADHYDLEKVKRRILEHLAVRKLNPEGKSPILCFVGPPGVGKTSLGQSIARAMGRPFERVSLGGVHDEAEIRGHRRTYIGALPGNIVQALRKAGTRNPVLMLDEIDKLGSGVQGDPASALLEVLDPEQNATFRDNYLGVPFDLSRVLFIATANVLDQIPAPLRDRMEVIELPGYTEEDKLEIARRYLLDRQRGGAGLTPEQCEITDAAIAGVIRGYTREAGCRNLERELGNLCRHAALKVALGEAGPSRIDAPDLAAILGPVRFEPETASRTSVPGVATGLGLDPGGRRDPVRGGQSGAGQRTADSHWPVGRGDEGKRPGRAEPAQGAGGDAGDRSGSFRSAGHPYPRACRRNSQGWPQRRGGPVHGIGFPAAGADRAPRCGHDGRDHPARPGAASRRYQGKGACRSPGGGHQGVATSAQPARLRGNPRVGASPDGFCLAGDGG